MPKGWWNISKQGWRTGEGLAAIGAQDSNELGGYLLPSVSKTLKASFDSSSVRSGASSRVRAFTSVISSLPSSFVSYFENSLAMAPAHLISSHHSNAACCECSNVICHADCQVASIKQTCRTFGYQGA